MFFHNNKDTFYGIYLSSKNLSTKKRLASSAFACVWVEIFRDPLMLLYPEYYCFCELCKTGNLPTCLVGVDC